MLLNNFVSLVILMQLFVMLIIGIRVDMNGISCLLLVAEIISRLRVGRRAIDVMCFNVIFLWCILSFMRVVLRNLLRVALLVLIWVYSLILCSALVCDWLAMFMNDISSMLFRRWSRVILTGLFLILF